MGLGHEYKSKTFNELGLIDYDEVETNTWKRLFENQREAIYGRACDEFIDGIDKLQIGASQVPQLKDLNIRLGKETGWACELVPAVIPAEEFFTLLASKKFPVATFIRHPDEFDYLEEPDIFHEVFGHCPLLTNKAYANFVCEYGKLALASSKSVRKYLFRLFWFTVEFGLLKAQGESYKAYGGGILSSPKETVIAVEDPSKERIDLIDPTFAMRTTFRIDIVQPLYFCLTKLEDLYKILDFDLARCAQEAKDLGDFPAKYPPKPKNSLKKEK